MKYSLRPTTTEKSIAMGPFSDLLSTLLANRGIGSVKDAETFLLPDYDSHTHDPFLMRDMDKAVDRVYKAIKSNERVVLFSDYDADGIPGGVILHDLLKKIGYSNFENYIPHRHDEGFGLNSQAIEEFKNAGATLMITIDCGIADIAEVTYANASGIDVIVTDHHMPVLESDSSTQKLPPAYAILNPKVADCSYPEKMLCGSGVIFKFVQAFLKKYGEEFGVKEGWEKWLLDLVGIATLSDMVPLVGENRTFAFYGLQVLKKTRRPGLSRLFTKLKIKREHITEDDIGFTITPRINAASRMGEPSAAFNLLSTDDEVLAGVYAETLEHVNNERKGSVAALVKEVRKILSERDLDGSLASKKAIVLGNPTWRPSLLGLVANSLAEEYGKPAFLWGRDGEGVIKGSCRSGKLSGASVLSIMQKTPDSFLAYGGHGASGGFEVSETGIFTLAESLEKAALEVSVEDVPAPNNSENFADAYISLEDISWTLYKDIEKLAPFGMGNQKPLFLLKNARVHSVKSFGKEKNHTEITFQDMTGRLISAIQFFFSRESLPAHVKEGSFIDLAVHIEKSSFKNYPELRLRIVDIL